MLSFECEIRERLAPKASSTPSTCLMKTCTFPIAVTMHVSTAPKRKRYFIWYSNDAGRKRHAYFQLYLLHMNVVCDTLRYTFIFSLSVRVAATMCTNVPWMLELCIILKWYVYTCYYFSMMSMLGLGVSVSSTPSCCCCCTAVECNVSFVCVCAPVTPVKYVAHEQCTQSRNLRAEHCNTLRLRYYVI